MTKTRFGTPGERDPLQKFTLFARHGPGDPRAAEGDKATVEASRRSDPMEILSLRDDGIRWVFYFQKSEVPDPELWTIARAEQEQYLRLAVTFGTSDRDAHTYRSTTVVHLWQIGRLPSTVSWRKVFVHVFTHEPLHHAIGRALAEIGETGDQEWVISKLGDGRWW